MLDYKQGRLERQPCCNDHWMKKQDIGWVVLCVKKIGGIGFYRIKF